MTDTKMAEKRGSRASHRHALRDVFILSGGFAVIISVAVTLLNHNPPGQEPAFSPLAGGLIVLAGLIGFVALTLFYMKRTDEHDMSANLWGGLYGWLFIMGAGPVWWMLHHSGLAGPVNLWALYFVSALVAAGVWGWLRFR
jgi:hypothetical protein